MGYTPARPLLHFTRAVFARSGWSVQEIWWNATGGLDGGQLADWVMSEARRAVDVEKADRIVLVGKSLGTFATGLAAERSLPGIWLTPLLTQARVVDALSRAGAPTLLIGGSADPAWDGDLASKLGHPYLEIANADHGMEIEDDPAESVKILGQVTATVSDFVAGLEQ
ncbi:MAG: alpha/beta hydrolase [Micromonosporaceae bacterium]